MRFGGRRSLLVLPVVAAVAVGGVVAQVGGGDDVAEAASCAPGFTPVDKILVEIRHEMHSEGEDIESEGAESEEAREEAESEEAREHGESEALENEIEHASHARAHWRMGHVKK